MTAGYALGFVAAEIDLPTALFSTQTWVGNAPSNCDTYGNTLALNGTPIAIADCQTGSSSDYGTAVTYLTVFSATMPDPVAGDVITISWGSSYTSTLAPLAGRTVYVLDATSDMSIAVTLLSGATAPRSRCGSRLSAAHHLPRPAPTGTPAPGTPGPTPARADTCATASFPSTGADSRPSTQF